MICACEELRREPIEAGDERWGETPFRIGMWVGSNVTPNTNIDARLRDRGRARSGPPPGWPLVAHPARRVPVVRQPARPGTGRQDGHRPLADAASSAATRSGRCPFTEARSPGEGIPVVTVDEEIYRLLPAFVISTADKFAQLPWQGATAPAVRPGEPTLHPPRLPVTGPRQGRGNDEERDTHHTTGTLPPATTVECVPLRPPDLIIQDELHLIAGPLGTLVGLYETAIDELASWTVDGQVVRPKVVASTATVRRAASRSTRCSDRRLAVFPPPVLDVERLVLRRAAARRPTTIPVGCYLGVCAHGPAAEVGRGPRVHDAARRRTGALRTLRRGGRPVDDAWSATSTHCASSAGRKRLVDDDVKSASAQADQRGLASRDR